MKYTFALVLLFCCKLTIAQSITQTRVVPAQPTVGDTVLLIADLQFRSSPCFLDSKSHSVNGNTITASTQHCVGIASAICYAADTFVLGVLNAGRYTVNLTLSSGAAPAPCTPGIVPSDTDTMSFTVQTTLGIEDLVLPSFSLYPNPATDQIDLSNAYKQLVTSLKVLTATGAVVLESDNPRESIDISGLAPGVYYVELYHKTGVYTEKFIKE